MSQGVYLSKSTRCCEKNVYLGQTVLHLELIHWSQAPADHRTSRSGSEDGDHSRASPVPVKGASYFWHIELSFLTLNYIPCCGMPPFFISKQAIHGQSPTEKCWENPGQQAQHPEVSTWWARKDRSKGERASCLAPETFQAPWNRCLSSLSPLNPPPGKSEPNLTNRKVEDLTSY